MKASINFSYNQARKTWRSLDSLETLFALLETNKHTQVTVTKAKGMINGHYYHTRWLTYTPVGEKKGFYNNGRWVISFQRRQHMVCILTFSPGGPGGPAEPGCPSLPCGLKRQFYCIKKKKTRSEIKSKDMTFLTHKIKPKLKCTNGQNNGRN